MIWPHGGDARRVEPRRALEPDGDREGGRECPDHQIGVALALL